MTPRRYSGIADNADKAAHVTKITHFTKAAHVTKVTHFTKAAYITMVTQYVTKVTQYNFTLPR